MYCFVYCRHKSKPDVASDDAAASFHPRSSVSKTFMPQDEMKLYTKLAWSYKNKNLNLPRDTSGAKDTFESFNNSRNNYLDPKL
jgi:hypothetical protein